VYLWLNDDDIGIVFKSENNTAAQIFIDYYNSYSIRDSSAIKYQSDLGGSCRGVPSLEHMTETIVPSNPNAHGLSIDL
jgi:hypothetical protein